jgi:GNAT superfamily N-acetyltransferase
VSVRDWPLVVRRATPADRDAVLGFASRTWDGWDYIPNAWEAWLAADDGVLLVGCAGEGSRGSPRDAEGAPLEVGRPIAVARVALVSPTEAWLEGIRVDPRVRGLGVATDFQAAELRWAAASGAHVVRYATGQRNEASHRLGARHGFNLLTQLASWQWHAQPPDGDEDREQSESGFDPATRAAATRARHALLDELGAAGLAARAADADEWWARLDGDQSFAAARRLCEHRAWTVQELTPGMFDAHVRRGEVLVMGDADDWSLGILHGDALVAEDADLHLATLAGTTSRALALATEIRRRAGQSVRFRVAHDAPLVYGREAELNAAGFHRRPYLLHILARPLDPLPEPERPGSLVMADEPAPLRPTLG